MDCIGSSRMIHPLCYFNVTCLIAAGGDGGEGGSGTLHSSISGVMVSPSDIHLHTVFFLFSRSENVTISGFQSLLHLHSKYRYEYLHNNYTDLENNMDANM